MLKGVGPEAARGRDVAMLLEILERTAKRVGLELKSQPAVEAELRGLIGRLYLDIGRYNQAEEMLRAALSLNRKLHGPESAETAASLSDLAWVLFRKSNLAEAERLNLEALEIRTGLFGRENADVAASLDHLGSVYRHQRRFAEAEKAIREGLEIRTRLFTAESLPVAESLHNLAVVFGDLGRPVEAEAEAQRLLGIRVRLLGADALEVADALEDAAWAAGLNGKLDEQAELYSRALKIRTDLQGEEHPKVAKSLYAVGENMRQRGELSNADGVMSAAVSIQRRLLGSDHPDTLYSLGSLGRIFERKGKWVEAEGVYREVVTSWRSRSGNTAPRTLYELQGLLRALVAQEKFAEAERLLNETLTPAFVKDPASAELLGQRIQILGRQKRWKEAASDAATALEHEPTKHSRHHELAALLAMTKDRHAYEQLCQKMLSAFSDTADPYTAERVASDCLLLANPGVNLQLVDSLATRAVESGSDQWGRPYFCASKGLSAYRMQRFAEAIDWADRSLNSLQSADPPARARVAGIRAMALWRLGNKDAARASLDEGNRLLSGLEGDAADLGESWRAWLVAKVMLEEATGLITPRQ
jgi:tetratricopeptide (TPR) repeat protein